jgi:pimeloyl-ACP methyl ester carboxylesterase
MRVGDADLEVVDLPASKPNLPELLLLHEGVGSVSMWRDFPQEVAKATGCRTVAYSREGFGKSSPRKRAVTPRFMHEEAHEVIPELRRALGIANPVLIGHSTGASMALIHAGADRWNVAAVVAMAPLSFVEASNIASIRQARTMYETTKWREKLGRHHDDVDSAFYAWNDIWLDPAFASWSIAEDLASIRCPILAILGSGDQYSTPTQVHLIRDLAVHAASFEFLELGDCGHAPHKDRPAEVLAAISKLVERVTPA